MGLTSIAKKRWKAKKPMVAKPPVLENNCALLYASGNGGITAERFDGWMMWEGVMRRVSGWRRLAKDGSGWIAVYYMSETILTLRESVKYSPAAPQYKDHATLGGEMVKLCGWVNRSAKGRVYMRIVPDTYGQD